MGYYRAGFDVIVGVDIAPQPRYPFSFVRGDALEYVRQFGAQFDVIHASPPCQAHSLMLNCRPGLQGKYPDLIAPTRNALQAAGRPYVIENVPGAPLLNPVVLCGTYFGLKVYRHRLFESNLALLVPPHSPHRDQTPRAAGGAISPRGFLSVAGHIGNVAYARKAMGIDWMTRDELAQAIPPAYTEFLGGQLYRLLEKGKEAP